MVSDYLEVAIYFVLFFTNINFFHDFIFHESEIRTVLLEVSIDLWLLKKSLLKTSKIVLMYSNSLAIHFSSMVHAKCLLPRLDRLLLVRSCLQNFYQCTIKLKRAMKPMFLYRRMTYRLTSNSNYMTWTTYTIKKFSQNLTTEKKKWWNKNNYHYQVNSQTIVLNSQ